MASADGGALWGLLDELVHVETTLWNRVERALVGRGEATLSTVMSLRVLNEHGQQGRVQDLSAALAITIGASSKLVDRLERDGLAVRRPHPADRRSSLIALTAQGEATLSRANAVVVDVMQGAFPDGHLVARARAVMGGVQAALDEFAAVEAGATA